MRSRNARAWALAIYFWAALLPASIVFGQQQAADVQAALEQLTDPEYIKRVNALIRLGNLGSATKPAENEVRRAMADPEMGVRLAAAHCLWQLTGNTQDTLPILLKGLDAAVFQSAHWTEAAGTLGEIGPPARAATTSLIEILQGTREKLPPKSSYRGPAFPWFHVRASAAIAMGRIGPAAKAAVPALIAASQQADAGSSTAGALRVRAARALWRIDPDNPESLRAVLRGLKEKYPLNRIAIDTVILIGPPGQAAVPALTAALADEHYDVRRSAIDALGLIGSPAASALSDLSKAQQDDHFLIRDHAALAITRIGPPEQSLLPILTAAAKSASDAEMRQALAERLAKP